MLTLQERTSQLRRAHAVFRYLPLLSLPYLLVIAALGGLGPEHFILCGLTTAFCWLSDQSRRYAKVGLPILLYACVYDSMRWYEDYIRSPVIHLREPYDFDLRLFGIRTGAGLLTPNEWWQLHTSKVLDFVCGLSYTAPFFIGESILVALYLLWKGQDRRAQRFVWVFVATNFIGFSFYYVYPAAPPWYVAAHGFVADLSVRASPGGAIRFDQLVGLPVMQSFYGKSADVFGAIPSLHVVYPFLALVYGGARLPRFRVFAAPYFLLVCFSAVYLNHHYLLDIFIGLGLATAVAVATRLLFGPLEAGAPEESRSLPGAVPTPAE